MTRRWWRRNLTALIALVVVVGGGVFAVDRIEFGFVRNTPVAIEQGGTYTLAGWTFGPVSLESLDPVEVGTPPGTDPVRVTMRVEPGASAATCNTWKIVEPSTGRTWRTTTFDNGERPAYPLDYCPSDRLFPFHVAHTVMLLEGLDDHLVVTITVTGNGEILDLEFPISR